MDSGKRTERTKKREEVKKYFKVAKNSALEFENYKIAREGLNPLTNYVNINIEKIAGILRYEYVAEEFSVYGTLSNDYTKRGVIDYLFKQASRYTLVEAELCNNSSEVWSSFKVIAYKSAFCLDRGLKLWEVKCMVFLHDENYHPNIRNILAVSDIKAVFFNDTGQITKVCE